MSEKRKYFRIPIDSVHELLAIKLYEHDAQSGNFPAPHASMTSWLRLFEEDREMYRRIARGEVDIPYGEKA